MTFCPVLNRGAVILFAGIAIGCNSGDNDLASRMEMGDRQVEHTIQEIPIRTDSFIGARLRVAVDSPIYRIGIEPTSDAEEFGYVDKGVLLGNGWAVVGDLKRDRLVAISPNGRAIPFGRHGEGPEEFVETTNLLRLDDSTFEVIDNGLFRRTEFRGTPNGLRLIESHRFEHQPREVCIGSNGWVSLDYDRATEHTLHRLAVTGKRLFSFGEPTKAGSNRLNESLSQGALACLPDRQQVLYAATIGAVLLYDEGSGTAIWRRQLEDYTPILVEEVAGGLIRFTYAPPPARRGMYPASITRLNESVAALQLGTNLGTLHDDGKVTFEPAPFDTRLIDLVSGAERGRQMDLPLVLDHNGDQFLVKSDDPEPWVALVRFRLVTEGEQ